MQDADRSPRPRGALVAMLAACTLALAGFVALGAWQLHRLAWKEALIERVERNVHGQPVAAPGPPQWNALPPDAEYLRVQVRGRYHQGGEVLVAATTELGAGYWVVTPLQTAQGWVLVNRGFVPPELRGQVPRVPPEQSVVGLLRFSEPGGRPLQANVPAAGRWYSRDVAAIAAQQGLTGAVAPYFIDLQATPGAPPAWPRAGLTVLQFPNNHLVYAFTWFALAAGMAAALWWLRVDAHRSLRSLGARP